MANVKITQLPTATTPLTGTEVFPLVQGTTTKQVAITGLFTSPTMTNPRLGTVGQADLINATGLPISTGVAGLGTGIATFLGTPSSSNLRAAVTDETGTGSLVFATSPTLVTPNLGTPTAMVATNITGTALGLIAGSAITNANLTGAVTSVGNATSLGSFTSAQLATALTDETGSGANVFATSPTLVTPALGTPSAAVLTNATGLPISTGVSGLGTGVATFLATPSSANLLAAVTDETGTGSLVFATSPTLVTPLLGTPTSGNFSTGTFTWPTFNQNTTGTASNVTGTVLIANGGTGQITANASFNALAPSQTGNSGKYLTTDGSNTSWATNPLGTVTSVGGTGTVNGITLTGTVTTSGNLTLGGTLSGVNLTSQVTGTLPTANGGTNLTSFTSGGVVYASSTSALATGSAFQFDGNNIGINTTNMLSKLNIANSYISVGSNANTSQTNILLQGFGFSNSANIFGNTSIRSTYNNGDNSASLEFYTGSSGTATAEVGRFDKSGNFGIGTSSPSQKLEVNGGVRVAGSATLGTALPSGVMSFESPVMRCYVGDGTGYSWAFSKRSASTTTDLMTLNDSGNLGIGTSSPAVKLDVVGAIKATESVEVNGTYPKIYLVETDAAANNKQWWFESNASVFQARVLNDAISAATTWLSATRSGATITQAVLNASSGGHVYQQINGTTVTDVSSTGLAVTGLVDISAATSGQIKFPATQNASSDANTLDDYEEGTWTPSIGGTATYTAQSGIYTKVGRLVTLSFDMTVLLKGTGSGSTISGLPFTSSGNVGAVSATSYLDSLANSASSIYAYINSNTIVFNYISAGGGTSFNGAAVIGNGTRLSGTAIFMV